MMSAVLPGVRSQPTGTVRVPRREPASASVRAALGEGRRSPAQPGGAGSESRCRLAEGTAWPRLQSTSVRRRLPRLRWGQRAGPPRAPPLTRAPQAPDLPVTPGRGPVGHRNPGVVLSRDVPHTTGQGCESGLGPSLPRPSEQAAPGPRPAAGGLP